MACKQLKHAVPIDRRRLLNLPPAKAEHALITINTEEFQSATTFREQVVILVKTFHSNEKLPELNFRELANMMNINNAESLRHQWELHRKGTHLDGRAPIIDTKTHEYIRQVVEERFENRDSIALHELSDLLFEEKQVSISYDTLRRYLDRSTDLKIVSGVPMEAERVQNHDAEILRWYEELNNELKGVPRPVVFNSDETGCDEHVDARTIPVVVPATHDSCEVNIPIDRSCKRATLTACICADGSVMKPLVLLSRDTIDEDIGRAGYTQENTAFMHQDHSYMTKKIFKRWVHDIFLPDVAHRRKQFAYQGKVILLIDGFKGHAYDTFEQECIDNDIQVKYLIAHSSHMTQPLDQCTFAELKRVFGNIRYTGCRSKQSNKIIRMLMAWRHCTARNLVTGTFAAGIVAERYIDDGLYYCCVDLSASIRCQDLRHQVEIQAKKQAQREEAAITEEAPSPVVTRPKYFTPKQDKAGRIPLEKPDEDIEPDYSGPTAVPKKQLTLTQMIQHRSSPKRNTN
jgi:hypothetical protein